VTSPVPPPNDLASLGRTVAEALPSMSPDRLARQRARVVALAPVPSRRGAIALSLGAAVALLVVAGLSARFAFHGTWSSPALTARVGTTSVAPGQWIAAMERPLPLRFSDGSEVRLLPGTHTRVASLDAQGARMLIERGRVEVSVRHARRTRWLFSAGPYTVQVTGTRFDLTWEPDRARFDLVMHEGGVTLRGPRCLEGLSVRARDEVHADLARGTLAIGPGARAIVAGPVPHASIPQAPVASPPVLQVPDAPVLHAPTASGAGRLRTASATQRGLAARPRSHTGAGVSSHGSSHGPSRGSTVLPAPETASEPTSTAMLPSADAAALLAEAEAALRARDTLHARELLLALRGRFPRTPEATRAAFQLGVTTLALGAPALAAGWFERYLQEAPAGALANEARGRRMEALRSAGDTASARRAAEDYLLHDPEGAFAPLARAMLHP
jgi:hypothetical protein